MTPPDPTPKLPTWIFIVTDLALLGAAGAIAAYSPHPFSDARTFAIVLCVIVGAIAGLVPIVAYYEREKNETLDDRQRALEALSRTISSSAEQISIAANGLHEIAELSLKNLRHAEHLPQKLQEKIADFQAQLAAANDAEKDELEKELVALRTSESERLESISDKIAKSAADWARLEASTEKNLAASRDVIERAAAEALAQLTAATGAAAAQAAAAAVSAIEHASGSAGQTVATAAAAAERSLAQAQARAAADLEEKLAAVSRNVAAATAATAAETHAAIDAKITASVERLERSLEAAAKAPPPPAATIAPPAPAVSEAAPAAAVPPALTPVELPAPAPTALDPVTLAPVAGEGTAHPPKRPRKPRREPPAPAEESPAPTAETPPPAVAVLAEEPAPVLVQAIPEIAPVAPQTADPFVPPAPEAPAPEPASLPAPAAAESIPEPVVVPPAPEPTPTAPLVEPPVPAAPAAAEPTIEPPLAEPADTPEPAAAPEAAADTTDEDTPLSTRRRAPRKPEPDVESDPGLGLEIDDSPAPQSAELAERVLTSDGATRLVVTAYIGIGNRLFIRGEGPGLSWEKGVPLQFVSIGKWRWETSDATAPVSFKLYKNDSVECTALGAQNLDPGHQQELTASF